MPRRFLLAFLFSLLVVPLVVSAVPPTNLSIEDPKTKILELLKTELGADTKLRIDGLAERGSELYLLLVPNPLAQQPVNGVELSLSHKSINGDLLLSNGWIYTPIVKTQSGTTIKSFDFYPQQIKDKLLSSIIIPEFIIPFGFVLPRDLAMLAGHLPIKLADVELASDREAKFRKRLLEDEANTLSFLSYDHSSGKVKHIELKPGENSPETKTAKSTVNEPEIKATELNKLNDKLSFLSRMRQFKKDIYISDFNQATIYKVKAKDDFSFEEYLKLPIDAGLKDFVFSEDGMLLYVLTAKTSKLNIYRVDGLKLVKELDVPSASFALSSLNPNASQADYIVFASKAASEIDMVSTFEHRISSKINLVDKNLMPEAYVVAAGDIFLIARDSLKNASVKLLALDMVTGSTDKEIVLDFEPMGVTQHAGFVYVSGKRLSDSHAMMLRIQPNDFTILATADLGTDIIDPRILMPSNTGAFMLVSSSASDNVGVVDLKTMELVKKINIGSKSHQLLVLPNKF